MIWRDLSGAELRARLEQRGWSREAAAAVVLLRDNPAVAKRINEALGGRR